MERQSWAAPTATALSGRSYHKQIQTSVECRLPFDWEPAFLIFRESIRSGYFFNCAGQFCTSVNGSLPSFRFPLLMRNFLPSALTSYGPYSRWIPIA
jgi:hypothetical protein